MASKDRTTNSTSKTAGGPDADQRKARLAQELRANLQKRKTLTRQRASTGAAQEPLNKPGEVE